MDNSHMTAIGTKVFSEYIGAYLKENFEISDRRGDENIVHGRITQIM